MVLHDLPVEGDEPDAYQQKRSEQAVDNRGPVKCFDGIDPGEIERDKADPSLRERRLWNRSRFRRDHRPQLR